MVVLEQDQAVKSVNNLQVCQINSQYSIIYKPKNWLNRLVIKILIKIKYFRQRKTKNR